MHEAQVEATRYPRNPLDVLAQQIVAMVAMDAWDVDDLFARRALAPRRSRELSRSDLRRRARHAVGPLSLGRFAELRPRVTWDRVNEHAHRARRRQARGRRQRRHDSRSRALRRVPRRRATGPGAASASSTRRWCSRAASGETFLLGASTWRIEEITHDRVLVSPAPGQPGKMPFWKADAAGPPARARAAHRRAGARAAADAAGGRDRSG